MLVRFVITVIISLNVSQHKGVRRLVIRDQEYAALQHQGPIGYGLGGYGSWEERGLSRPDVVSVAPGDRLLGSQVG